MKTNRREFLSSAVVGGLASSPMSAHMVCADPATMRAAGSALQGRYSRLDEILKRPVLRLFAAGDDVGQLLRLNSSFLWVRSRTGGSISVAHSGMRTLFPVFSQCNLFYFASARELDLIWKVYQF
jgi:hypothetical protein